MNECYVQCITASPPAWERGGPTRLSHSYIGLAKNRFSEIRLLTSGRFQSVENVATAVGLEPSCVLMLKSLSSKYPISVPRFANFCALAEILRYERVYLHLLEFKSTLTIYAFLLKCIFPDKVVLIHSVFGQISTTSSVNLLDRLLLKYYAKFIDLIICQSESEKDSVVFSLKNITARLPSIRISDLEVLDLPKPNSGSVPFIREALLRKNHIKALFLGRVVREKGVLEGINFLSKFSDETKSIEISVVGPFLDSKYESELEFAIQKCRLFSDYHRFQLQNPALRYEMYLDNDIFFILPTVKEESSLASIEALLCGCKIIINDNCIFSNVRNYPSLAYVTDSQEINSNFIDWLNSDISFTELLNARTQFVEDAARRFLGYFD